MLNRNTITRTVETFISNLTDSQLSELDNFYEVLEKINIYQGFNYKNLVCSGDNILTFINLIYDKYDKLDNLCLNAKIKGDFSNDCYCKFYTLTSNCMVVLSKYVESNFEIHLN